MSFPNRVAQLRKSKDWTPQQLAERVSVKVLQIRRYENGSSQPTLEVIKKMAIALGVTTEALVFSENEHGTNDELKLQFEALSQFDDEERKVTKAVLESLILKHNAKRALRAFVE